MALLKRRRGSVREQPPHEDARVDSVSGHVEGHKVLMANEQPQRRDAADRPLHIALVTHYYRPEQGAPQRRWAELVARFKAQGHRVTVLAPPPHYPDGVAGDLPREQRPGARETGEFGEAILRMRFREHGPGLVGRTIDQLVTAWDTVWRGSRALRADRPDVVVATVPGMPSILAGTILARMLRRPCVVEMRDAWPDLIEPSGLLRGRGGGGPRALVKKCVHSGMVRVQRSAPAIVATTEGFAAVLRKRGARRVEVVRNGALSTGIDPLGPRDEADGPLRVVYVGTVGRSQCLETAVRAAARLGAAGTPVELRIVGPGARRSEVRDEAARLGVDVDLRGPVPREEVVEHLAWADTQLVSLRSWLPFEWTVPSKLYDALGTGRHITAVVAGEAAEIVAGTGAGDVVPPEDDVALAALWTSLAEDRSRLRVRPEARSWALEHANYDVLASRYIGLLSDVVQEPRR